MTPTPETTRFEFTGGSDDLVEVTVVDPDGSKHLDEYTAQGLRGKGYEWKCDLVHGGVQGLRVHAHFMPFGVWGFSVSQLNEDTPIPDWSISIRQAADCHYSAELVVEAAAGTQMLNIAPSADDES